MASTLRRLICGCGESRAVDDASEHAKHCAAKHPLCRPDCCGAQPASFHVSPTFTPPNNHRGGGDPFGVKQSGGAKSGSLSQLAMQVRRAHTLSGLACE